jgi:hypothetical protein
MTKKQFRQFFSGEKNGKFRDVAPAVKVHLERPCYQIMTGMLEISLENSISVMRIVMNILRVTSCLVMA